MSEEMYSEANPEANLGQQGEELGGAPAQASRKAVRAPEAGVVDLMYYGFARVSVRGPVTGVLYEFSRLAPICPVDARDAVSILKTRLFRRIR